eukprot:1655114-Rhodomonas_salina.1
MEEGQRLAVLRRGASDVGWGWWMRCTLQTSGERRERHASYSSGRSLWRCRCDEAITVSRWGARVQLGEKDS